MGVTFSSNFGDFEKNLRAGVTAKAEEALAQRLAKLAMSNGLTTAEQVDLNITGDEGGDLGIDEGRVRARANELIRGDARSIVDDGDLDDDSGYGPDSYFGRAMAKDD